MWGGGAPVCEKQASPTRGPRAAVKGAAGVAGAPLPEGPAAGVSAARAPARARVAPAPACAPSARLGGALR